MAFFTKPYDAIIDCKNEEQFKDDKFISQELLRSLTINRIKADKPSVILLTGESGEGKSATALRLATDILALQGIEVREYLNDIIVYNPFEFAEKIDSILHDERLKKINVIILDEARGIVKAVAWNSFVNQAIADINAVSRGVKPLVIIIVSQDVGDIDRPTRKTIKYEFICSRPLHGKVRIHPVVFYKYRLRGSVEKIELRYRNLKILVKSRLQSQSISPPVLVVDRVPDDIWAKYKESEVERKTKLIRNRTQKMVEKLKKEWSGEDSRVDKVYAALKEDTQKLSELTIVKRGYRRLNPDALEFVSWDKRELKELERKLKNMGDDLNASD